MATFYLATIKPEDYAEFWRILPHDLDSSYDRWLFLRHLRKMSLEGAGFTIIDFEISSSDFLRTCDDDHSYISLNGLFRFAEEKGLSSLKRT